MDKITKIVIVAFLFSVLDVRAFDSIYDDQALMLNINIPLGASEKQLASPRLELRFDTMQSKNNSVVDVSIYDLVRKPAILEFPLGQEGIQSITVGGHNIMLNEVIYAADGDATAKSVAKTVGLVLLAGVLVYATIVAIAWSDEDVISDALLSNQ